MLPLPSLKPQSVAIATEDINCTSYHAIIWRRKMCTWHVTTSISVSTYHTLHALWICCKLSSVLPLSHPLAPSPMGFMHQILNALVVFQVPPILYFLQNPSYPHDNWLERTRQQPCPVVTGCQNNGNQATLHSIWVLCDSFAAIDLERQWQRRKWRYALILQSPVVTICTASLTFSNSTFCPHSAFMCFVWIWKQTAIIFLYIINWMVCITLI